MPVPGAWLIITASVFSGLNRLLGWGSKRSFMRRHSHSRKEITGMIHRLLHELSEALDYLPDPRAACEHKKASNTLDIKTFSLA